MPDDDRFVLLPFNRATWRDKLGANDALPFEVAVRIRRLSLLMNRATGRTVEPFGLNFGDAEVLAQLFDMGPPYAAKPSRLSNMCMVTTGAMTGRVDRLQAADLVERIPSLNDRRALDVRLTRKGRTMAVKLARALADNAVNAAIRRLSLANMQVLATMLEEIEVNVVSFNSQDTEPAS